MPHRTGKRLDFVQNARRIHMVALNYMHYNFVRIHSTIKTTPAIAAGISRKAWTLADIVALSDVEADLAA